MGSVATRQWSSTSTFATLRARHLDGGHFWLLELTGEADVATLSLLRQELEGMRATNREDVVVDVTGLAFCDVASAHLLLTARRASPITLRGATGSVERVFDLVEALQRQRLPRYLPLSHTA